MLKLSTDEFRCISAEKNVWDLRMKRRRFAGDAPAVWRLKPAYMGGEMKSLFRMEHAPLTQEVSPLSF